MRSKLFKNKVTYKLFASRLYKQDSALNNPQMLIYHENKPNLTFLAESLEFFST